MKIDEIKNGIVIDHIPLGKAMELYAVLGLSSLTCPVAMIMNAASLRMGKKDIIKIDAEYDVDIAVLGYIAPNATVNIIRDGAIVEKKHIGLPAEIRNVIRCRNPRCITSTEQELPQIFRLTDAEKGVYRCVYCESKAQKE